MHTLQQMLSNDKNSLSKKLRKGLEILVQILNDN